MPQYCAIRNGGKTDENAALRFLRRLSSNGQGVAQSTDLQVSQHGTPNASVDIPIGDLFIPYQDYGFWVWNTDSPYNLAIGANTSGNPRIDVIVAYIDLTVVSSSSNNNPGALKFLDVQGTPSGSPSAPNSTAIQSAVGAGNPYYILAQIAVANGFSSITTSNITDKRSPYVIGSNPKFGFYLPGTAVVANNLSWNPIAPQSQTLQGLYAYAQVGPVGSGLTIQIYNVTQGIAIGTITIAAGSQFANTTSLTNASLNAGDVIEANITAVGSTTPGQNITVIPY